MAILAEALKSIDIADIAELVRLAGQVRATKALGILRRGDEDVVRSSDMVAVETMLQISPANRLQPLVSVGILSDEEAERGPAALERWHANPDALLTIGLLACREKLRRDADR